MSGERPFYQRPLEELDAAEWEALCDGCGRCCLHKFEDEDTGELAHTWLACDLLDCETGHCSDYARRRDSVPDCLQLTLDEVAQYDWLPPTCAYRLRHAGQPLPTWHPLLTGDPDSVRRAGVSVAGRVLRECDAPDLPVLDYVVDWPAEIPLAARLLQPVEPDSDPGQEAPGAGGARGRRAGKAVSYVDLFVYGTLKRGHGNHRAFCSQALEITPASVPGRLYDLPRGYPGAVIPASAILARASGDPEVDAALQRACLPPAPSGPELARERVHGEIIRLPEPRRSLPPVDALEDFRPDGRGMYRRALVSAATDHGPRIVWMYWMPEVFLGHYLPTGVWPPDEEGSPAPGAG